MATLSNFSSNENFCEGEGAIAFADLLKFNKTINYLNLSGAGLDTQSITSLSESLCNNNTVVKIDLSNNDFEDCAADAIQKMIRLNNTITHFSFNTSCMTDTGIRKIYEGIQLNKSITQFDNEDNSESYEEKPLHAIQKIVKTNKLQAKNLQTAVKNRNVDLVNGLIRIGASANYQNAEGNTALHIATDNNEKFITTCLLKYASPVLLKNRKGALPYVIPRQFKWVNNFSFFSNDNTNTAERNVDKKENIYPSDIIFK